MTYTSDDLAIQTNELMQPGYVCFGCGHWGLPDNTIGKTGWHVVYRPLGSGYLGHDHVTDAMREAVRTHYDREQAAVAAADAIKLAQDAAVFAAQCAATQTLTPEQRANRDRFVEAVEGDAHLFGGKY